MTTNNPINNEELREQINDFELMAVGLISLRDGGNYTQTEYLDKSKQCKNELLEQILSYISTNYTENYKYDDIFKWLLGEKGDFKIYEPKYSWRTELRQRLHELKKKG